MKIIQYLVIASSFLLIACSPNKTLSGTDIELLTEACNSLRDQEKLKQCQVALEKLKGESKPSTESTTAAKTQAPKVLFNFKDIPLGQPGAKTALIEMCKKHKSNQVTEYDKRDRCKFDEDRYSISLSYGNLPSAYTMISLGNDDSLEVAEIWDSKVGMLGLVEILTEKYGQPKKTNTSVENGMGTKFDKEIFVWIDSGGNRITIESIYTKIDQGRVLIESAARVAAREIEEKKLMDAGKSNL